MSIKCCKNCEDRHPNCHATCPLYLEEKIEHEKQRERANKIKKADAIMWGYKLNTKKKYFKGRNGR